MGIRKFYNLIITDSVNRNNSKRITDRSDVACARDYIQVIIVT
jgi:hypothetical protein